MNDCLLLACQWKITIYTVATSIDCDFPPAQLMRCNDALTVAPITHGVLTPKATCLICAVQEEEYASTCSGLVAVPLKARCATQLQGDVALLATYVYSARCRSLPSICSSVLVLQVHNCQPPPHLFYPKYPLYVLKANMVRRPVL
jgi:hypothetical protein